jgi:hypothetical protein
LAIENEDGCSIEADSCRALYIALFYIIEIKESTKWHSILLESCRPRQQLPHCTLQSYRQRNSLALFLKMQKKRDTT